MVRLAAILWLFACFVSENAAGSEGIRVKQVDGRVGIMGRGDEMYQLARVGMAIKEKTWIETRDGELVVEFGNGTSALRIGPNSMLIVERFRSAKKKSKRTYEIELDLRQGRLLGVASTGESGSKYQIKLMAGVCGLQNIGKAGAVLELESAGDWKGPVSAKIAGGEMTFELYWPAREADRRRMGNGALKFDSKWEMKALSSDDESKLLRMGSELRENKWKK